VIGNYKLRGLEGHITTTITD